LLQLHFPKRVKLHLSPIKELFCSVLYEGEGFLGEVAEEGGDIDNLLGDVDVVAIPGGKEAEPLPILLKLIKVVAWLGRLDGLEVLQNCLQ
jgi:hypothetical protein